jgi:hypothetical protein
MKFDVINKSCCVTLRPHCFGECAIGPCVCHEMVMLTFAGRDLAPNRLEAFEQ